MNNEHPITPPPELVQQWWKDAQQANYSDGLPCWLNYIATQAARWGADQELEACCEWFRGFYKTESWVKHDLKHFRAARRPKPPSLKEQALQAWAAVMAGTDDHADMAVIRRALEQLDD